MTQLALADAENRLAELVHQAEAGETVTLTEHGKPVAVLVSAEEYQRLGGGKKRNFWDEIQAMRSAPDFEPVDLTDEEIDSWRDRSPGRFSLSIKPPQSGWQRSMPG